MTTERSTNPGLVTPEGAGEMARLPGGGYRVTFIRRYERPLEDLWEAITSPEGLDAWYPTKLRHTGRVGDRVTETFESTDGTPPPEVPEGFITEYDPPHVFEMHVDGPEVAEYEGMRGQQTIRMESSAGPDETSALVFQHDLEHHAGALDVLAGWHWCLESLAMYLGAEGDASKEYHDRLVEWYRWKFG